VSRRGYCREPSCALFPHFVVQALSEVRAKPRSNTYGRLTLKYAASIT
jgi:hypothetical protein